MNDVSHNAHFVDYSLAQRKHGGALGWPATAVSSRNMPRPVGCSTSLHFDHFFIPRPHATHTKPAMATWREMTDGDIPGVMRVADDIHRDLPETEAVVRERLSLFPEGCFVLVENDKVGGYIMSFPVRYGKPPALDTLLGGIPPDADQYYLHDLAILPGFRGRGAAAEGIGRVLEVAKRYPTTCLISVYGTVPFWGKFGFTPEPVDALMEEKLRGYGEGATYLTRQNN
jgi:GNAT superfamily N-acetyltransferase